MLHKIKLGQLMPLHPTSIACHSSCDQGWIAHLPVNLHIDELRQITPLQKAHSGWLASDRSEPQ